MGPSPSDAFASLEQLACSFDPVELLVGFTQRFLFHPEDQFQAEDSEIQRWARRIELVAGLLLRRPRTVLGSKVPARDDFERVGELAEVYLASLSREMLREAAAGPHSMGLDIATEARNHSMTVRGDAYPHQFYKFAKSLYGPHEAWFRANLGFTIDEGISISLGFIGLYEQRNHASRQRATAEFAIRMGVVPSEDTVAAANSTAESVIEDFHLGRAKENLGLTVEELAETSSVCIEICRHFLERMSQSFGYTHPQHPDAFRDAYRAGWDFSTLSERPFLQDGKRYYMLLQPMVGVAIYTTFYFDVIRDNSYKDLFNRARGAWLEAETAALLRRVFPTDSVISNPRYPDGTELSDVLVLYDGIILVIQCKSKGLRFESKTGLDPVAIREDLQKAVKAAFDQGIRARKFLMGHLPRISIGPNHELELDSSQVAAAHVITVTPLPLQMFTSRIANQDAALQISRGREYPWAVSLGDLDIITDILPSPTVFIHYAARRVKINETPFLFFGDEIDIFGLYLNQGLYFDDERFQNFDIVSIPGFSPDVDRYVYEKYALGRAAVKPKPTMPEDFARLLTDIESSGSFGATRCVLTLLDHSVPARAQLMEGIRQTKERFHQTGKMQRLTALKKGGAAGVSFLAMDSSGDPQALARNVQAYAVLQKHVERCPIWMAMGWDRASARIVDVCLLLSGEWCEDRLLDRLAEERGIRKRSGTNTG